MDYHHQLLKQAKYLCGIDARRPQQANLRRAVSGAYYALFHFLTNEACRQWIGGNKNNRPSRQILSRAFIHGSMNEASKAFHGGALPPKLQTATISLKIPGDLRRFAGTFVKVQDLRHRADYDLSRPFVRPDVLDVIDNVERCIKDWPAICDDPAVQLYLICLLAWRQVQHG